MSLNYMEIDKIIREITIEGYFFRKIYPVDYETFILEFYRSGETKRVLISTDPKLFRIHLASKEYGKLGESHNLVEFIKKYMINGVVKSVTQPDSNRIVEIEIVKKNSIYKLLVRLWGGCPNILITDDNYKIIHLHRKSTKKGELPGEEFKLPSSKKNRDYTIQEKDSYSLYIEELYSSNSDEIEKKLLQEKIEREKERLSREIKGLEKRKISYNKDLEKKELGDLLTSNLYRLKGGESIIELDNWEGLKTIIKLDPKLSPSENRDKLYKEFKKAKSGLEQLDIRKRELEEKLKNIPLEISNGGQNREKIDKTPKVGLRYSYKGYELLVGRNGKENDKLLRERVKGNDYWLHIRDYSGGYVFIKNQKGKTVPLDVLIYGGNLAIHYSKGKKNGQGDIYYTKVKYLRRAKGDKLGKVIPTRSRNLFIKMDKNIILGL